MPSEKWISPYWVASHNNYRPAALKRLKFPKRLQIYDVTCRDGEQMPGVVFRKEEKLRIAQKLDEIGIQRIEAGMPAVSQEDFDAVKEMAHLGLKAKVVAFSRARREDVDLALKCGASAIVIEAPSSDTLIETAFGWKRQKVLDMALDTTSYAKAHGLQTTFFAVDSTRANPSFLRKLYTSVVKDSHVDSVAVVDTFGVTSPEGFSDLVGRVKEWVKVPIEVHCHNDFGLGTANALAGLAAGASIAHTNVNGIGERAGGASTEEVALALRILYGRDLGFNYGKFNELSKLVQEFSGASVAQQKPVVGATAFGYEAGIAVMLCYGYKRANMLKYGLSYLPEFVGNRFSITLGKKSGAASIRWQLEDLKYTASDEEVDRILAEVKRKGIENKRGLTTQEFVAIADKVLKTKNLP